MAFHGAGVEYNNKAYLLLAPTFTGKTTLTTFLTTKGFGYISDDCVLIDKKGLDVFSVPSSIHLRPGGLSVMREIGFSEKLYTTSGQDVRHIFIPPHRINKPIPLAAIMFISRDSINSVHEMDYMDKIQCMVQSLFNQSVVTVDNIHYISELSKKRMFKVSYSDDMNYIEYLIRMICN